MSIFIPFFSSTLFVIYMINSSFFLNSSVCFGGVLYDEVSMILFYMTCLVIFISYFSCLSMNSQKLNFVLSSMLLICLLVFFTNNMFTLYLFYEASLVPILYIIMKWGSYPERSVSSIMLLVYTSIFTFPFLYVLFVLYELNGTLIFTLIYNYSQASTLFSCLIFFTFAVKLPIYGLHFWLPMAHVEAPTFGSMILAGILLKLGGVGLLRFSEMMNLTALKSLFYGYFLTFLVYVTIVCCFQSDFKRLVAYSSVSHMMTIPIMLMSSCFIGFKGLVLVMFLHGISSPLLFYLVGILYSFTQTRQHVLMRGLITMSPLLAMIMTFSFFFTLSAPPYPSFVSEVFFTLSALFIWDWSFVFISLFLFLSIVYNLLWFTHICFFSQASYINYSFSVSYVHFLPIYVCLFMAPVFFACVFYFIMFMMAVWGQLGFQEAASVIMELLNYFHDYMMMILIMIMSFVTYIFLYIIAIKRIDKYTMDSHVLETIWTVVPMFILCFMAFPSLYLLYLMEDVSNPSLTVKVIGHQWYWEYQYSNSWLNLGFDSYMLHDSPSFSLFHALDVDNRLVLPTSVNLLFLVTSADVIHSWTVPSLGIKADAIPGRLNSLISMSMFSGVYYGQCSEICGSNHSYMPIVLEFVPASVYSSYVSTL